MKSRVPFLIVALVIFASMFSCQKSTDFKAESPGDGFIEYIIPKGEQFSDKNVFTKSDYTELKFLVRFNETAKYQTIDTANQMDINKLYGFADNKEHHQQFSARFGWVWYQNALHIWAMFIIRVYGVKEEIGTISLNEVHACSIKVMGDKYLFTLDGKGLSVPRESKTVTAIGYKLYPYFGGDELAPHTIHIFIMEQ